MYGFVIAGAIDGFSRRVLMLCVNTDNCASTVLRCYRRDVVARYGVPLCLRTDRGGENVDVLTYQCQQRGGDTARPFITGTSVRNQRIERLFGDSNRAAIRLYMEVFAEWAFLYPTWFPQGVGVRFCLVELFQRRIQADLDRFVAIYNNHRMYSGNMRGLSPNMMAAARGTVSAASLPYDLGDDDDDFYGVDPDGYDSDQDRIERDRGAADQVYLPPV